MLEHAKIKNQKYWHPRSAVFLPRPVYGKRSERSAPRRQAAASEAQTSRQAPHAAGAKRTAHALYSYDAILESVQLTGTSCLRAELHEHPEQHVHPRYASRDKRVAVGLVAYGVQHYSPMVQQQQEAPPQMPAQWMQPTRSVTRGGAAPPPYHRTTRSIILTVRVNGVN